MADERDPVQRSSGRVDSDTAANAERVPRAGEDGDDLHARVAGHPAVGREADDEQPDQDQPPS